MGDITVASFRIRWDNAHKTSKVWVHCMEELYKCWNDLEQKIVTLTTWVDTSKSSEPAKDGLSIDKLEEQLNVLKANFTEKQSLIEEMMAKCKAQNDRRMTMLPVEEMRKLSQMVKDEANKKSEDEYPEVPTVEGDAPPAPAAAAGEDAPAPAPEAPAEAPAPAEEEVKGEPEL